MEVVDPFAVLDLPPDATPDQVAAAYRRLAKRWHPDRAGADAALKMVEINLAYDLLRSGDWQRRRRGEAVNGSRRAPGPPAAATARRPPGAWLPAAVRRALGGELLRALE